MNLLVVLLTALALPVCAALTHAARKMALERKLLDIPNERSSHKEPTPRGGGIAIVVTASVAFAFLAAAHVIDGHLFAALCGGLAVAVVGYADDRRPLGAGIRLAVHAAAALWALAWLGGLPAVHIGTAVWPSPVIGYGIGVLAIVWIINLYNFMDGIDGIAATEAVFVVWAGALLGVLSGASNAVVAVAAVFGGSCAGFLVWNWPPARIFMGDVGSGYLGYIIGIVALQAGRESPSALITWLILGGAFFVDATVTLARRTLRGERVYEAHRSHAYQYLARRWNSHRRTTLTIVIVNCAWLLPWAWIGMAYSRYALWCLIAALAPLTVMALAVGAGRAEGSAVKPRNT
jgi:Fuc2NAc and GlcNAc transferase